MARAAGRLKGLIMISIAVLAALIFVLVAAVGLPYGQTWYARWNPHR